MTNACCLLAASAAVAADLSIERLEPTPLFPKPAAGQPLRQQALLYLNNTGAPVAAQARITVGTAQPYTQDLGQVGAGRSTNVIHITDLAAPARIAVEVGPPGWERVLARQELAWQPQKKWNIYCISYSHHDLGFGNYPHRLRTEIRHANMERPLKYCADTDNWDEESRFRFVIETSEPVTSFLATHSAADAAELARRIREGRIQVGAMHNTANTEQLSHELLTRLFYLSGRHTPDLLGVPRNKTALIDDVIGLTWPLATALKEAGVPYFFHGYNGCGHCLKPAEAEPVFYWQGPDLDSRGQTLVRSVPYGGYAGDSLGDGSPARIHEAIRTLGATWPYDALLLQDGTDFQLVTIDNASKIRAWNARFSHPRLICSTLDMFFDAVAAQADPARIKTFAKDGNNQWADQDATDAWLLGLARRQGEAIPSAEKFATIATTLAGGGYPWTDIYQAYHRLLLYHEHTDAIDVVSPQRERMQQYETELEEDREMVTEARDFCDRVREQALEKLAALTARKSDLTLLVFNPLSHARTDVVRFDPAGLAGDFKVTDAATGQAVPHQRLDEHTILFVAADVPSMGHKSFAILPADKPAPGAQPAAPTAVENKFYRLTVHPVTGAITSLRDKDLDRELVDQAAPHQFNEYLYERFEKPTLQDPSRWYRVQSAQLSCASGPVADVLTVRAAAVGVESLVQRVILYHDLKRIDFSLDLVKSPSGRTSRMKNTNLSNKESVFVALPFEVPDFRFHYELPGGVAEPIRDQFDGSCTAYYAARHFADVSNDRFGVTVASPEVSLVEYGRPRSCPIPGGQEHVFERTMTYPPNSRMYLYLLDNMFDVNIRWDQRGPMRFTWSIRSHPGGWQAGRADEFGWEILNPLLPKLVRGRNNGPLPPASSFLSVQPSHVVCTTLKPAEANGSGLILRFRETQGTTAVATVSLPFAGRISEAVETDLVENDRPIPVTVEGKDTIRFEMRGFGLKTIRIRRQPENPPAVASLKASPVSDMQVRLSWEPPAGDQAGLSHFNLYRGSSPDFKPSLLNLVARPAGDSCTDQPELHYGGWINNRLEPGRTYYYRVAAVDRWNNQGPVSPAVVATTLKPAERNMVPLRVESLRAILVSPLAAHNYVNLIFRTSCESDVRRYEIHRSTQPGFTPDASTKIGTADADALIKGSTAYGHVPIDYHAGDYDHMMFQDDAVQPSTTYSYRVCAIDTAGQKGPLSQEASVTTKGPGEAGGVGARATASSTYAEEFGPDNAIDGESDPYAAWISKPYGGGTRDTPGDAWLVVEFPRRFTIQGVKIIGDDRPVIPVQKAVRIDYRDNGAWKKAGEVRDAQEKTIKARWPAPLETDALRIYIPASDLPKSTRADIPDGVVRICELILLLPDGKEAAVPEAPWNPAAH